MRANTVKRFWESMDRQRWEELPGYFSPSALVYWPNTNEKFSVEDFTEANRQYPGRWRIGIERMEQTENTVITVVKVTPAEGGSGFHATSFFEFSQSGEIVALYEYWGDDGEPPEWRAQQGLGSPIG